MPAAFFVITDDFGDRRKGHIVLVIFLAEDIWGVIKNQTGFLSLDPFFKLFTAEDPTWEILQSECWGEN